MRKKVGQSLAAVAVILTITSMTGAGADGGGRGDQHTCTSSKSLEAMSCFDKYEKDGKVKKSINRRVYGYEPKSDTSKTQTETKPETQEHEAPENFDEPVDLSDIPF